MSRSRAAILVWGALLGALAAPTLSAAEAPQRYIGKDTLEIAPDDRAESQRMLDAIQWTPHEFAVQAVAVPAQWPVAGDAGRSSTPSDADRLVLFPSPRPRDDQPKPVNDVVLEWYQARCENGQLREAPAVLLLHSLDRRLFISRAIGRTLARRGVHAFVMHMPGWGLRATDQWRLDGPVFFEHCAQAVADARRARDAIAALPTVDTQAISIQGTSLGGFIAATSAAIDGGFHRAFILLAGGRLYEMFENGQRETAFIRQIMERHGYSGEQLRKFCEQIEPTTLAHRLDPKRTWLISAMADQVVPAANARALAEAALLDEQHHLWVSGDHYTAAIHLPWAVGHIAENALDPAAVEPICK